MSILDKAKEIIYGDREKTYGSPDKNLALIAAYWTAHINSKYGVNITLTTDDVCGMMILLKQARLANDPSHRDSLIDMAGYAALQERVQVINANKVVPAVAVDVPSIHPAMQCKNCGVINVT